MHRVRHAELAANQERTRCTAKMRTTHRVVLALQGSGRAGTARAMALLWPAQKGARKGPQRPTWQHGGSTMNPFFAALIACGYMASVFVIFGLVPRWRHKAH
jgi:hypothetical protein